MKSDLKNLARNRKLRESQYTTTITTTANPEWNERDTHTRTRDTTNAPSKENSNRGFPWVFSIDGSVYHISNNLNNTAHSGVLNFHKYKHIHSRCKLCISPILARWELVVVGQQNYVYYYYTRGRDRVKRMEWNLSGEETKKKHTENYPRFSLLFCWFWLQTR